MQSRERPGPIGKVAPGLSPSSPIPKSSQILYLGTRDAIMTEFLGAWLGPGRVVVEQAQTEAMRLVERRAR